jgi:hypothetical protein
MASVYFGLDVFCQFEARDQEFDAVSSVRCTVHWTLSQLLGGRGYVPYSGTLASKRQNISSPKYNDDISLLIFIIFVLTIQYLDLD